MIYKNTPYEVKRFVTEAPYEGELDYYLLYYNGKPLPNQISVVLNEPGRNDIATVTVTLEMSPNDSPSTSD